MLQRIWPRRESLTSGINVASTDLDAARCAPIYDASPSLIPVVAEAIASATSAAEAAVATRDPTKVEDLPVCAVSVSIVWTR